MQDHTVPDKACLGEAVQDQGFTDLGTLDYAVSSINCLAYYGISAGRTADTFDPKANVTRSEMALFLYATANLMRVDLMGGDMMANYGDIAELGENRQNAITALARNGIMSGSGGNFRPNDDITRAEMAVALVSLVDHVSSNLRKNDDGLFVFGDDEDLPNDSFADAYASVPVAVNNAISAAYELGITSGVGNGMFDPSGTVRRQNMAVFIINALNHSNVRPAGLTAQVYTRPMGAAEIIVSVRDANFAPVANAPIDAFKASAPQEDRAFKQDGSCSSRATLVDGANKCTIDGADPVTLTDGNTGLAQLSSTDIGEDGLTVWLWTGDVGDKFGDNTDALEISVDPQPQQAATATVAAISSDLGLKGNGDARYGQDVTFTIQLQDAEENDAATPAGGVKYQLRLETRNGRVAVDSTADTVSVTPGEVELAGDGSGSFVVTASDLDPFNDSELTVEYILSRTITSEESSSTAAAVVNALLVPGTADPTGGTAVVPATTPPTYTHTKVYNGVVVFSDTDAKVTSVSVDAASHQSPGSNGNVGTAATATVLDQYGRPMSGQGIVLSSDAGTNATTSSRPRFTGPNGQVRIGYSYSGSAAIETITAIWDGDTADVNGDGELETGEGEADDTACNTGPTDTTNNDICGSTKIFWVGIVTDENSTATTTSTADQEIASPADVLSHDADNQQIVIDGDAAAADDAAREPRAMSYDSNDFFTVDTLPTTMAEFAAKLTEALATFQAAADDTTGSAEVEPTLAWSGYVFDDSSSATWFQLTTNLTANEADLP